MVNLKNISKCVCGNYDFEEGIYGFNHNNINFSFKRCKKCRKFLLEPRPPKEELGLYFSEDYFGKKEESKFIGPGEKFIDYFRSKRARSVMKLVKPGGNILDFGCGSGQFLAKLSDYGFKCYGTELSAETAKRALKIKSINVHFGDITGKTYRTEMFDLASIWHVLDHLYNPDEMINYISKWVKHSGCLMIAFPNMDSWQAKVFKGDWFGSDPLRTFFHYDMDSIKYLLDNNGFAILKVNHLSWEQNLYWILQSILHKFGFKRNDFYEFLKGNRNLEFWRDVLQIFLILIFMIPSIIFAFLEALFNHGGSLEITAKKVI